ncbi:hypothetical protein [Nonomuraea sp. NPDC049400]|uniref:hypothetical protein n=1 Tax=Nonomuraea sp. NPDC049400 TaxID=3364352 RepID=UPI0037B621C3
MPDDPPHLPGDSPYDDYDGPRGFADVDGGYPVEEDLAEPASAGEKGRPPPPERPASPVSPVSPVVGRRLHNPLPGIQPPDDDDWYGPEPARATWRTIAPIAVLIVAAGLGVWLAIPSATEQALPPGPASPTPEQTPDPGHVQDPPTRQPIPWQTPRWTPTPRRTPSPSATPARTPSRASSPSPSRRVTARPARPFVTSAPQPRSTVTVTKKVTLPPKPERTRHAGGPEEPPGRGSRPTGRARSWPTCHTWGDCHDDPPKG